MISHDQMPLRNLSCPITAILSLNFRISYPPTKLEVPFMSDSLLHYAAPAGIVLVFTFSSGKEYVKSCFPAKHWLNQLLEVWHTSSRHSGGIIGPDIGGCDGGD
jgi:hypothetical protein